MSLPLDRTTLSEAIETDIELLEKLTEDIRLSRERSAPSPRNFRKKVRKPLNLRQDIKDFVKHSDGKFSMDSLQKLVSCVS